MPEFIKKELRCPYREKELYGELYLPGKSLEKYPFIILSHGMYSSYMATGESALQLAQNGFACYCFDYSGCSYTNKSGGDLESCSILTEADELSAVIDYFKEQDFIDRDKMYLLGQSMGGIVSSLAAARYKDEIKAMILMYPAFLKKDYITGMFPDSESMPEVVENYLGIPNLNLGRKFFTDILQCPFFDIIKSYTRQVLVIHGTDDCLIPMEYVKEAVKGFEAAQLISLEGAEHGFQLNEKTISMVTDFLKE